MKTILHSRIYEAATGGNIPIIILHGLLGTGDNWASISRRYASDGFTTHAIDLPCHGRSPHIEEINIDLNCIKDAIIGLEQTMDLIGLLGVKIKE